jgi:hypothetical protein
MHDFRYPNGVDHQDCIGYLNGGSAPGNIYIIHCTLASLGTTNILAFQASTSVYGVVQVINNYLSGDTITADLGHPGTGFAGTGWVVTGDVWSTAIQSVFGMLYTDFSAQFTSLNWNGNWPDNTLHERPY